MHPHLSVGRLAILTFALAAAVACSGSTSSTPSDAGVVPAVDLTCPEIFNCAAQCPDNDPGDACANACVARGSAEGKTITTNLVTCYQSNACADAACLQTNCSTELDACVKQVKPSTAKPLDPGNVPAGAAPPADLVGKWHYFYSPTDSLDEFTFNADGTAKHYITTAFKFGACANTGLADGYGHVVFAATTMTYYEEGGTQVQSSCGGNGVPQPIKAMQREYGWSLNGSGQLILVDKNTTSCIEAPTSSGCTKTYDKQ